MALCLDWVSKGARFESKSNQNCKVQECLYSRSRSRWRSPLNRWSGTPHRGLQAVSSVPLWGQYGRCGNVGKDGSGLLKSADVTPWYLTCSASSHTRPSQCFKGRSVDRWFGNTLAQLALVKVNHGKRWPFSPAPHCAALNLPNNTAFARNCLSIPCGPPGVQGSTTGGPAHGIAGGWCLLTTSVWGEEDCHRLCHLVHWAVRYRNTWFWETIAGCSTCDSWEHPQLPGDPLAIKAFLPTRCWWMAKTAAKLWKLVLNAGTKKCDSPSFWALSSSSFVRSLDPLSGPCRL